MSGSLPPSVLDALRRGETIEAIRLLREATGLGLKEAKDRVDAYQRERPAGPGALAPGQVGRRGGIVWWAVALVLVAIAAYALLGR